MTSDSTYVKSSAMPAQTIKPLAAGATSPMQSAQIQQQQQIQQQMALIGQSKTGGRSKRRKYRGGGVANNAQIVVPSVQPGAVNSEQTAGQYAELTALASKQQSEAVFDAGNTAGVAATQKGGRKRRRTNRRRKMKGGVNWSCLSGGKRSRRKRSRRKRSRRKRSI